MRILYVDCFLGMSGDMMVGALADLGITPSTFEWELSKLELGDYHLHFERQTRGGISGVKFEVHGGAIHAVPDARFPESHHHAHSDASSRPFSEIRELLQASGLSDFVKLHAIGIFRRMGEAEAKIHGIPIEEVQFHEVGALDSIADIVLTCVGLE